MKHRQGLNIVLLIVATGLLLIVLFNLLPSALQMWRPFDYGRYIEMASALRQNPQAYGSYVWDTWYPLPAQLWIFVPLSFMPDWFRLIWVLLPLAFILRRLGVRALLLFLFPPLWFAVADGMVDLWLLFPLVWMLENRPGFDPKQIDYLDFAAWAGVGVLDENKIDVAGESQARLRRQYVKPPQLGLLSS